jgi:hypothetical protein
MTDDITLKILKRVSCGELPMNSIEAEAIAPLERFGELKDAGLIEAAVVKDHQGSVCKVHVSGITHHGRALLQTANQSIKHQGMPAKSMRFISRLFWMTMGVAMTLLGMWLAKMLGLK